MRRFVIRIFFDQVNFGFYTWMFSNLLRFEFIRCLVFLIRCKAAFKSRLGSTRNLFTRLRSAIQPGSLPGKALKLLLVSKRILLNEAIRLTGDCPGTDNICMHGVIQRE